jgi:hypothetical protein
MRQQQNILKTKTSEKDNNKIDNKKEDSNKSDTIHPQ